MELTLTCQQTDDTFIGHIGRIKVKSSVILMRIRLWKRRMDSTGHFGSNQKLICATIRRGKGENKEFTRR